MDSNENKIKLSKDENETLSLFLDSVIQGLKIKSIAYEAFLVMENMDFSLQVRLKQGQTVYGPFKIPHTATEAQVKNIANAIVKDMQKAIDKTSKLTGNDLWKEVFRIMKANVKGLDIRIMSPTTWIFTVPGDRFEKKVAYHTETGLLSIDTTQGYKGVGPVSQVDVGTDLENDPEKIANILLKSFLNP